MRNNFIHQMLNVYKYNLNRKNDLIPVFEIDKVYQLDKREGELNLTLLTPAIYAIDKINKSNIIYNINGLKGVINQYVSVFNNKVTYEVVTDSPYCYEKECISINLNGEVIGYIGRIKDSLLKNYDIVKNPIYIATINLNKLIKEYKPNSFIAKPLVISPLMSLYKDLTFVNEGNKFMGETIKKALQVENVIGHEFIDKYEKDNSITYTFRFFFNNKNNLSNDEIIS
jgi:phenylalanyl-tRNA synthetase beta chain